MKINNKSIILKMVNNEISSINFKGIEILNTTKKWSKKFPILFPAIGMNKIFNIENNLLPIQKHGFWKELKFKKENIGGGIVMSTKIDRKDYPFEVEIDQYIYLNNNKINVSTTLTGQPIPYQFGYHPAFNYDLGNIKYKGKAFVQNLNGSSGIIDLDITNISQLDWDNVDTFIVESNELTIINNNYSIKISTNLKYMGIWTNGDKYICIEPWSNLPATINKNDNSLLDGNPMDMSIEIIERKK